MSVLLATWFGCGYFPKGPGTAGSLCGLAAAYILHSTLAWPAWAFAVLAAAFIVPAVWAAGTVATTSGAKDPQIVVIDEVLGQWVTLAGAPALGWKTWLGAFVLFRLFDIWKPVPVRNLERLPGGVGIIADDLMAGIYAALVLSAAGWFNLN
jgi:phosphatidylglycerophosphatase A